MKELRDIAAAVRAASAKGEALALATLVRVSGSSYRRPGARLLLGPEGSRVGSLSGGCLEADVSERARECILSGRSRLVRYDLRSDLDLLFGHGVGCAGVVEVFVEPLPRGEMPGWLAAADEALAARRPSCLTTVFSATGAAEHRLGEHRLEPAPAGPPSFSYRVAEREDGRVEAAVEPLLPEPALFILGAGEDARSLAALAGSQGWFVAIVDPRAAFASAERFPDVDAIVCGPLEDVFPGLPLDERSAAVLVSHHYLRDFVALERLLAKPPGYIGLLGTSGRTARLLCDLEAAGFVPAPGALERLYSPAGLDVGAETPDEIALSIVAEVRAVLRGRTGGFLRDRRGSVHGRKSEIRTMAAWAPQDLDAR